MAIPDYPQWRRNHTLQRLCQVVGQAVCLQLLALNLGCRGGLISIAASAAASILERVFTVTPSPELMQVSAPLPTEVKKSVPTTQNCPPLKRKAVLTPGGHPHRTALAVIIHLGCTAWTAPFDSGFPMGR